MVVSAMGDTTDELLALAKQVSENPARRELDMLLSAGERISMALLSMALNARGVPAVSFTGSQSGIVTNDAHTNARIVEVRPFRVQDELARGKVVIVAGYQGVSYKREVTTLGRGGSDTTAVALAAALDAEACEIYSDVDGVYTADPRVVPEARRLAEMSYEEMQELAEAGAKVLNAQAVEFAKDAGHRDLRARHRAAAGETVVRKFPPRTPGRVVGVASETGLVAGQRAPAADAGRRCSALLDEHGAGGQAAVFQRVRRRDRTRLPRPLPREPARLPAPAPRRSSARLGASLRAAARTWARSPPSAPASTPASRTSRRACDALAARWRRSARRLDLELPHQPAARRRATCQTPSAACTTPSSSPTKWPDVVLCVLCASVAPFQAIPSRAIFATNAWRVTPRADGGAGPVAAVLAQDARDVAALEIRDGALERVRVRGGPARSAGESISLRSGPAAAFTISRPISFSSSRTLPGHG